MPVLFNPGDRVVTSLQKYRGMTGKVVSPAKPIGYTYFYKVLFDDYILTNIDSALLYRARPEEEKTPAPDREE